MYVLFEHQSSSDPTMPFRLLRYMVLRRRDAIKGCCHPEPKGEGSHVHSGILRFAQNDSKKIPADTVAPMPAEIRHLHISSRDHAVSQRFYEKYFGFRFDALLPRGSDPAATILRSPGGFQLFLEAGSAEKLPSWFHYGFFVESGDACRELYQRMQQDHVVITQPLVTEPFAYYFFADPDGHIVQVYFDPKAR